MGEITITIIGFGIVILVILCGIIHKTNNEKE